MPDSDIGRSLVIVKKKEPTSKKYPRKGIENIEEAMCPMYTTRPDQDRSGMGFAFMEAFMDSVEVESELGKGTRVRMKKAVGKGRDIWTTQSL